MAGRGVDNQKVLGNCSACNGLMQIPVVTDVGAFVKCPHCQGKMSVRELIATIAPEAEVVENAALIKDAEIDYAADRQRVYEEPETPKPREKFVVPNQLSAGASRRTRKRRERQLKAAREARLSNGDANKKANKSGRRSSDVNSQPTSGRVSQEKVDADRRLAESRAAESRAAETEAEKSKAALAVGNSSNASAAATIPSTPRPPSGSASTSRSSNRSSASSRRRSDEDDPEFVLVDVIKLLVGGVVAAPIAYLALLWIVGVDPFGMAPRFESLSPSLVPESLRSEEDDSALTPSPSVDMSSRFETGEAGGLPMPETNPDSIR